MTSSEQRGLHSKKKKKIHLRSRQNWIWPGSALPAAASGAWGRQDIETAGDLVSLFIK